MRSIQLMPGERILRDSRVTAWCYVFGLVGGIVAATLLAFLFGLLRSWYLGANDPSFTPVSGSIPVSLIFNSQGLVVGGLLAVGMLVVFSAAWSRRYVLTDSRLVVGFGVLHPVQLMTDLGRIQAVSMHQTVVGRIFGYGNLAIETADAHELLVVRYVDAPHEWFGAVAQSAEESEAPPVARRPRAASSQLRAAVQ